VGGEIVRERNVQRKFFTTDLSPGKCPDSHSLYSYNYTEH